MRYGTDVATVAQCLAALEQLADTLTADPDRVRGRADLDRTLACRVTDLDVTFTARLVDGTLRELAQHSGTTPPAQITLTAASDDLLAMLDGTLDVTRAVATGRVTVRANPFDLLALRKLR